MGQVVMMKIRVRDPQNRSFPFGFSLQPQNRGTLKKTHSYSRTRKRSLTPSPLLVPVFFVPQASRFEQMLHDKGGTDFILKDPGMK